LLSLISKVLESVVATQLTALLERQNLIARFQSSFRHCRSTETAVARTANDIPSFNDSGKVTAFVLLELSAGVDTIDYEILLSRLKTDMGITGTALSWSRSYLNFAPRLFPVLVHFIVSSYHVWRPKVIGPGASSFLHLHTAS